MSEKMPYRNTPSTLMIGITAAAISAANTAWPAYPGASYETFHSRPSYSSLRFEPYVVRESFGQQVAEIYALLLERQEPLGGEFEAIWDANVDSLYEA
jgi:hypothetical protein